MMHYQQVETKIWDDEWYMALPQDAMLAWWYLLTNSKINMAGLYRLRSVVMADYIKATPERTEQILTQFESDGVIRWDQKTSTVWVINMLRYRKQSPHGMSGNSKKNIDRALNDNSKSFLNSAFRRFYKWDKSSVPVRENKNDIQTRLSENSIQNTETSIKDSKTKKAAGEELAPFECEEDESVPMTSNVLPDRANPYARDYRANLLVERPPIPDEPGRAFLNLELGPLMDMAQQKGLTEAQIGSAPAMRGLDPEQKRLLLALYCTWAEKLAAIPKAGICGTYLELCKDKLATAVQEAELRDKWEQIRRRSSMLRESHEQSVKVLTERHGDKDYEIAYAKYGTEEKE